MGATGMWPTGDSGGFPGGGLGVVTSVSYATEGVPSGTGGGGGADGGTTSGVEGAGDTPRWPSPEGNHGGLPGTYKDEGGESVGGSCWNLGQDGTSFPRLPTPWVASPTTRGEVT